MRDTYAVVWKSVNPKFRRHPWIPQCNACGFLNNCSSWGVAFDIAHRHVATYHRRSDRP